MIGTWKSPRLLVTFPGVMGIDGVWRLSLASRCSLNSAVVDIPSMIVCTRIGPAVPGGIPPDCTI